MTDEGAGQVGTYAYDAWGNVTASSGSEVNEYKFTSRRWEAAVGLQYNRARFYDPQIGRFISPDPLTGGPDDPTISYFGGLYSAFHRYLKEYVDSMQPHRLNRYVYCANNQVNQIDPLGLYGIDVHLDRSFAIYVAAGEPVERALLMAFANQFVDDSILTTSMTTSIEKRNRDHFASRQRVQEKYLLAAANPANPHLQGSADHTFLDSNYAHAMYLERAEHLAETMFGEDPDMTYNDVVGAYDSAKDQFRIAYERAHPNRDSNQWCREWEKIEPYIIEHAEAQTDREKAKAIGKILDIYGVEMSTNDLRRQYRQYRRREILNERIERAKTWKIPRSRDEREGVIDELEGRRNNL